MEGNCLLSFSRLSHLSRLFRAKKPNLTQTAKNVAIIACKGSTSLVLQRKALQIFQFCAINNVSSEIEWVAGSLNEYADSLSRVVDFDDWSNSIFFRARFVSFRSFQRFR